MPRMRGADFSTAPGGKGKRTFQCLDCQRPDPLQNPQTTGWLEGELGKAHPFKTE
jgi:hypothetical protein